jgi:outer membrane protein TolC
MNRCSLAKADLLVVTSISLITFLIGCEHQATDYELAQAAPAVQKIHEIEPLQLQEAEPNEVGPPEANEPPATLELTLPECRALTLRNNLQLKAELISPAIAAARLSEEEAKFESSFFANGSLLKTDQPQGRAIIVDESPVPSVGTSQIERTEVDFGVQMPLRTGGTVTFDLSDYRTRDLNVEAPFNPSYQNGALVSVSQPLLRNAGQWVNTYSIRIAAYNRDIVNAGTKLQVITALAAIDRVYWRLYAARKELEVREQQYELAQRQYEQARRLVDAGQRPQVEVIRAEAGIAQQLEAIIIAENNLRDRERELKRVINRAGLNVQSPTVVVPATEPDPVRYELERHRLVRTAVESRMELLTLELQLLQDTSTVEFARNQTLPLASLAYAYNISGTGEARSDSLDMLFNSDFTGHRLGLQIAVPIGNEAARSRLRQAIYQRRQRLATRTSREDLITLETLNAIDQVEANWQRILAARQTSIVNARVYEAEQRQFELGLRTSTDVLDAQTKLADAQSAEIRALAEYQIALVDLAYATGTILGAARIHWEPIVPETDES